MNTIEFARQHGVCSELGCPEITADNAWLVKHARQVAERAIVLHAVVAVAAGADPEPVADWLKGSDLWHAVSAREGAFLTTTERYPEHLNRLAWRMEAEWSLLWALGLVESLGLPTTTCDARLLNDEIMPALGSPPESFIDAATLRPTNAIAAEDDRTYDLWCHYHQARRKGEPLPNDLKVEVLYERRYAFEWLCSEDDWDDVSCDS